MGAGQALRASVPSKTAAGACYHTRHCCCGRVVGDPSSKQQAFLLMGCSATKVEPTTPEPGSVSFAGQNGAPAKRSRGPKAKVLGGVDPRWDLKGFGAWLAKCPCVRVGFLRKAKPVGRRQVPDAEWVRELPPGAGVDGVQLYAVLSAAFGLQRSPELAKSELETLLRVLENAEEGDLVW